MVNWPNTSGSSKDLPARITLNLSIMFSIVSGSPPLPLGTPGPPSGASPGAVGAGGASSTSSCSFRILATLKRDKAIKFFLIRYSPVLNIRYK